MKIQTPNRTPSPRKSWTSPSCDWPRSKPWKEGERNPQTDRTHRIPEPGPCWSHWQSWGNSSESVLARLTQTSKYQSTSGNRTNPKTTPEPKATQSTQPPGEEELRQASERGILRGSVQLSSASESNVRNRFLVVLLFNVEMKHHKKKTKKNDLLCFLAFSTDPCELYSKLCCPETENGTGLEYKTLHWYKQGMASVSRGRARGRGKEEQLQQSGACGAVALPGISAEAHWVQTNHQFTS